MPDLCGDDFSFVKGFNLDVSKGEFVTLIGHSTGANKIAVYDHYKPRNQVKRYVLVAGNYMSGISVVDFTDPANAEEIAYADPAPLLEAFTAAARRVAKSAAPDLAACLKLAAKLFPSCGIARSQFRSAASAHAGGLVFDLTPTEFKQHHQFINQGAVLK